MGKTRPQLKKILNVKSKSKIRFWFVQNVMESAPITLKTLGLLFCYGIFIELVQSLTITRSPDTLDLLADALGLLVYFVLAPKFKNRRETL